MIATPPPTPATVVLRDLSGNAMEVPAGWNLLNITDEQAATLTEPQMEAMAIALRTDPLTGLYRWECSG